MHWQQRIKTSKPKSGKLALRRSARLKEWQIQSKECSENILSSATLPNWNMARLQTSANNLTLRLGCHCAEYRLAFMCLEIYRRRNQYSIKERATLYNQGYYKYGKIGLVYAKFGDYQRFRTMAWSYRSSLSHLMDVSIRYYLHLAERIYYLQAIGVNLKQKWNLESGFFHNLTKTKSSSSLFAKFIKAKKPPD